ncbi:hypothetical protein [Candidatus Ichthyocystis hellenicum]|uniref:hypothetical protein n=1 Tax=Candidatus Ichthyocystis hellenicum TaxID=1561003 RepID=UPI000B882005|nr:hypothetical protein [Candidatus Ichthyocystis hellenicum]
MVGVRTKVKQYGVFQDDNAFVSGNGQSSLVQEVAYFSPIASNASSALVSFLSRKTTQDLCLSRKAIQDLCAGYGYSIDFGTVIKAHEYNFFQEYAGRCGYQLTDNFLSAMNKHKMKLMGKISLILSDGFSFLKDFNLSCAPTNESMSSICYHFSEAVYDLRPKCIDVLQFCIVPMTIKSIFNSKVIDNSHERKMTYQEMEQFFLHYIITLERLIMFKIMSYWEDFCDSNKSPLSLLSGIDYSNPFDFARRSGGLGIPYISYPSAFRGVFESCLSFMAIDKIEDMMDDFVIKLVDELKKIVHCKCEYIRNCSDNDSDDYEKILNELNELIKEEFYKKLNEKVRDVFINFLNKLVIWDEREVTEINRVLIFEEIVGCMYNLLVDSSASGLCEIVRLFQKGVLRVGGRVKKSAGTHAIESKLGIRLHPRDNCMIASIIRKFTDKSRRIVSSKFCAMLKERYKFSDGTVISMVDWDKISKNLFPIAQETVRPIVEMERVELSRFLSDVRVLLENDSVLECYSYVTREATPEERDGILKVFTDHTHHKNRRLFSRIWANLISSSKNIISKDVDVGLGKYKEEIIFATSPQSVTTLSSSVSLVNTSSSTISSFPADFLGKGGKIISVWGLNIHPDDDKIILFIRRKFARDISVHFRKLFSNMLERGVVLPSGKVLSECSWGDISCELLPVAIESVEQIFKECYLELDIVLSKLRVIDVDKNDDCSCVIRGVTGDEKKDLMLRVDMVMHKSLACSARSSWIYVTNNLKSYVYGNLRVKFRHVDGVAILNIRRKYLCKLKSRICDKFKSMVNNKYEFGDDTIVGRFSWSRIYKKMFPVIQEEIKNIIGDEIEELKDVISRVRVMIDSGVDRKLTDVERPIVLENIMKLVYKSLRNLSKNIWDNVKASSGGNSSSVEVSMGSPNELFSGYEGRSPGYGECNYRVSFCYEDDSAISSIRKKFSSDVSKRISSKFFEMLKNGYRFSDGTVIDRSPWVYLSKRLLPIARKEIEPIMEEERLKINDVLLKAQVVVPSSGACSSMIRGLTPREISYFLGAVMKLVRVQFLSTFRRAWKKIIALPEGAILDIEDSNGSEIIALDEKCLSSVDFDDLSESCREKLDGIRLEFVGRLGPVVGNVVDSSLLYVDITSSILERIKSDVAEESCVLFREGGFLYRIESLLSEVKLIEVSGKCRSITEKERRHIFQEFMNSIASDRNYLVENRVVKLMRNLDSTT